MNRCIGARAGDSFLPQLLGIKKVSVPGQHASYLLAVRERRLVAVGVQVALGLEVRQPAPVPRRAHSQGS